MVESGCKPRHSEATIVLWTTALSGSLSPSRITPLRGQEICSCLWSPPNCHSNRGSSIPAGEFSDSTFYCENLRRAGSTRSQTETAHPRKSLIAVLFLTGQSKRFPHCQCQKLPQAFLSMAQYGFSHPSHSLASWPTSPHDPPPASSAFPPCLTLISDTFMLLCMHFFLPESPSFFSTGCRPYSASLTAQRVKNSLALQGTRVPSLSREDALEGEVATHSSVLAWRITWTEEPGGLQSKGKKKKRAWHNWVTKQHTCVRTSPHSASRTRLWSPALNSLPTDAPRQN